MTDTPPSTEAKRSPWQKFRALPKWLQIATWVLLALVLFAWVYEDPNESEQVATQETTTTAGPTTTEAPATDYAALTEAELKNQLRVENFTDGLTDPDQPESDMWYIASFESVGGQGSTTVRVVVQTPLTDDEAEDLGTRIFSLVGGQIEDLGTIVIRDTSGVDKANVYRRNVPLLNR